MNKRIEWIDFSKGFTILLVVFGHVLIGLRETNLYNEFTNRILVIFIESVYIFHMPVFFALSGYFFRPSNSGKDYLQNIKSKLISLGIPYVLFSVVMFLLKKFGGSNVRVKTDVKDLLKIYAVPTEHLWYLYTLFFIFVYIGIISLFIKEKNITFVLLILGYIIVSIAKIPVFAIQRTLLWAPFFYLGFIIKEIDLNKKIIKITFLAIYSAYMIWFILYNYSGNINYGNPGLNGLILFVSIILAFSTFSGIKNGKMFIYFKKYGPISLSIYLFHVPITSIARIVLLKIGIENLAIQIFMGIVAGWFLSIFADYIMNKIKPLDYLIYPARYYK